MTESPSIMRFKAQIRNYAKEHSIPAQTAMQNFMFERFLMRLSQSRYRKKLVIKGGFLISAVVGLPKRTTMDLDATLRGMQLDEATLSGAINEICSIDGGDGILFGLLGIAPIRKDDAYGGFRLSMVAKLETTSTPFSIDISAGDAITPAPVDFDYHSRFGEASFALSAYTIETVLAEKAEAIFTLGALSTRPRDYYDIKILLDVCCDVDAARFGKALVSTATHRGTLRQIGNWRKTIGELLADDGLNRQWEKYRRKFTYASEIEFRSCITALHSLMDKADLMQT